MPWNGPWLFRLCVYPALALLLPTPCSSCGALLGPRQEAGYCPGCWNSLAPERYNPNHPAVCAATLYEGLARDLLLEAKFRDRPELCVPLGRRMAAACRAAGIATRVDQVMPVPSHPLTWLRRGYNPARELARPVARCLQIPLAPQVLRRRWTRLAPLKRAGREVRQALGAGSFRAPRGSCRGRRILLVDDIVTTGATFRGCRSALLAAGAREVFLLAWARTPAGRRPVAAGPGGSYNDPHPGSIR